MYSTWYYNTIASLSACAHLSKVNRTVTKCKTKNDENSKQNTYFNFENLLFYRLELIASVV